MLGIRDPDSVTTGYRGLDLAEVRRFANEMDIEHRRVWPCKEGNLRFPPEICEFPIPRLRGHARRTGSNRRSGRGPRRAFHPHRAFRTAAPSHVA